MREQSNRHRLDWEDHPKDEDDVEEWGISQAHWESMDDPAGDAWLIERRKRSVARAEQLALADNQIATAIMDWHDVRAIWHDADDFPAPYRSWSPTHNVRHALIAAATAQAKWKKEIFIRASLNGRYYVSFGGGREWCDRYLSRALSLALAERSKEPNLNSVFKDGKRGTVRWQG